MSLWTNDEFALAVKLTSVQGRSFSETAEILTRHGYSQRTVDEIKDKIKNDAPTSWALIEEARQARKASEICGVAAPAPKRRMKDVGDAFVNFIASLEPGLSEETVCWQSRQASFDCNITDTRVAAARAGYVLTPDEIEGIAYYEAIAKDKCLWPLDNGNACGSVREVDKYCGAHHCRSLGDYQRKMTFTY